MGEGGVTLSCLEHCPSEVNRQRLPSKAFWKRLGCSISAGILLSRGWGPGANYSLLSCPNPRKAAVKVGEEHCFEGGKAWLTSHFEEATGVLSSNDAYGLSHSHPKWWPDSAWPGR
ncbi:hypothetical protein VNO80_33969 [Phaseolus coccineus]|uniref:Uncharacterized protein n=1 Tax=Phaseolus coccineus TaxID=3886 RepID=A0AAN9L0A8_PHACN